ncbi:GATA zinc finger domain-containing protein 14 [Teleopsis dalmanni]|uniref:GATA zinc finger domain-containing protein 14 n=1 Tax=Teleopsis dalmanni TaxID=139649 RepID=UPI0018CF6ABC|nr:GATA zinc finger domain-containing protein 14 [Teleopsis dalmanni]
MKVLLVTLCVLISAKISLTDDSLGKPTEAPLLTSTAKPSNSLKIVTKPTKSAILNIENKSEHSNKEPETSTHGSNVKSLKVTGLVTNDGNIYDIEGSNGIGLIESRQAQNDDQQTHVCNYGTVVIYSDIPCNEVTNVAIGEVQEETLQENNETQSEKETNNDLNSENDSPDRFNEYDSAEEFQQRKQKKRPVKNRKRNQFRNRNNKNQNRKRQNFNRPIKKQQSNRIQQKHRNQFRRQQNLKRNRNRNQSLLQENNVRNGPNQKRRRNNQNRFNDSRE